MVEIGEGQVWTSGEGYDRYVGRWSRIVARDFLQWLGVPPGASWLDVGCGTGALTETILASADPAALQGIDPSEAFVDHARRAISDPRALARDRTLLAPQGLASLLVVEIANQARPSSAQYRDPTADCDHVSGRSALGHRAHPRRAAQARHRRQQAFDPAGTAGGSPRRQVRSGGGRF